MTKSEDRSMTMKEWLLFAATLRYEILKVKGGV